MIEHVRARNLTKLYFYGHSFGGMVATQVAARLLELHGVEVAFILLDSSPYSKFDVLDQSWFDGVVFLYESGIRVPSVLRGGYELGERVVHKNERTWRQILDQTLEQLSPIAPSSVLIQTESAYIYHFDATRFADRIGDARMAYIGNPQDQTVNYQTARQSWARTFAANMVSCRSADCRGASRTRQPWLEPVRLPAHPGGAAGQHLPAARRRREDDALARRQIWLLRSATEFRIWLGRNG